MQPIIRWIPLLLAVVLAILPLTAATSGTALYVLKRPLPYDPAGVPFPYDPNSVRGTLLGTVTHRAGLAGTIKAAYDDRDGDPVAVVLAQSPAGMTLTNDPNSMGYAITWRPDVPGVYPVVVSATDAPPSGEPNTVTGTILWNVLPENREPFLWSVDNVSFLR